MSKDVKELLKEATKDLLTPETLTAIEEAVNAKAEDKAKLTVEAALIAQDDKHAAMLTSLMEKMDVDYTTKLQKLVDRLDESYAAKLVKVKELYDGKIKSLNGQLNEVAQKYVGDLSTKIDTFLESRLDTMLPAAQLTEAVQNVKAVRILEQIRNLIGINEASINSDVKAAMIDGKNQIVESKTSLDKVINENTELKAKLAQKEVDLLLEQKSAKLPSKKREHVKRVLAGKDAKFISENFEYVADMFDRQEVIEATSAKKDAEKVADKVDAPVVLNESKTKDQGPSGDVAPFMTDYLASLNR